MKREFKLVFEATFQDLVDELKARFPDGVVVAVTDEGLCHMQIDGDRHAMPEVQEALDEMFKTLDDPEDE